MELIIRIIIIINNIDVLLLFNSDPSVSTAVHYAEQMPLIKLLSSLHRNEYV